MRNFNAKLGRKFHERDGITNERTNIRTDERKGENYIPVGINAGGINSSILHKRVIVMTISELPNTVDVDETAYDESSHLDMRHLVMSCLYGSTVLAL